MESAIPVRPLLGHTNVIEEFMFNFDFFPLFFNILSSLPYSASFAFLFAPYRSKFARFTLHTHTYNFYTYIVRLPMLGPGNARWLCLSSSFSFPTFHLSHAVYPLSSSFSLFLFSPLPRHSIASTTSVSLAFPVSLARASYWPEPGSLLLSLRFAPGCPHRLTRRLTTARVARRSGRVDEETRSSGEREGQVRRTGPAIYIFISSS